MKKRSVWSKGVQLANHMIEKRALRGNPRCPLLGRAYRPCVDALRRGVDIPGLNLHTFTKSRIQSLRRGTALKRYLLLGIGWICFGVGALGVVIPVLPTTPLMLAAAFLFARCSPRLSAWMRQTKLYRSYVEPFKESGGISTAKKTRILAVSLTVLAVSAAVTRKPLAWAILACVAVFLIYLVLFRIPTVNETPAQPKAAQADTDIE